MTHRASNLATRDAEIRASGLAGQLLADRYGISPSHVSRIRATVPRPPTRRERFALSVAGEGWVAACMEPDEWRDWVRKNPHLNDNSFADRPCQDCPLGFAAEMRAIGRCNGSPGAVGGRHEEAEEEGEGEGQMVNQSRPEERVRVDPAGKTTAEIRRESAVVASTSARPWAIGKTRSPEAKANMAAAQRAAWERRRAAAVPEAANEASGPPPAAAPRPDVVLPCGECVHAAVCSIRPVLVAWAETVEAPVPPHEAIGVGALSINCVHYLETAS